MTTTEIHLRNDHGLYAQSWKAFLLVDGVAVSYVKLMSKEEYAGWASLCTVETREGFQGKGYARFLMNAVCDDLGLKLGITGGYTPEGFAAFNGKIPRIFGDTLTGPSFESMTFVDDWGNVPPAHKTFSLVLV